MRTIIEPAAFATLLAASIAAGAALVTLGLQLRSQRQAELRVAHRASLVAHVTDLGEALHSVIATSRILLKTRSAAAYDKWREYGRKAQSKLKELRPRLRYPLWGADYGIKILTRLPDWTDHLRGERQRADKLLNNADKLRLWIDRAVRRGYLNGKPPSWIQRYAIAHYAVKCEHAFRDRPDIAMPLDLEWLLIDDDDPALRAASEELIKMFNATEEPRQK